MAAPLAGGKGSTWEPVIRIFGPTWAGQKCCVHLRGAFPYFYIDAHDQLCEARRKGAAAGIQAFLATLQSAITQAMAIGTTGTASGPQRDDNGNAGDGSGPDRKGVASGAASTPGAGAAVQGGAGDVPVHQGRPKAIVRKLSVEEGIPIYGYNNAYRMFIKVQLYNPAMLKRVAATLQSGRVLDTVFQPYETHISFLLRVRHMCRGALAK